MPEQPINAELFIGIVARMGVDTKVVSSEINEILSEYSYETTEVKLTDALKELDKYQDIPEKPLDERYEKYIDACNEIRSTTGDQAAMARFGLNQIADARPTDDNGAPQILARRAFIINQLKNPQESELFRSIYGEHYVQISVHAKANVRERTLADKFAHDHIGKNRGDAWRTAARKLMDDDNAQEDKLYGQRVRDVFPLSDVVVEGSSRAEMKKGLDRFFRALFGDFRVTPTRQEYGMQLANTAALRSSDLSRQVGAAIMNKQSEVQSLGCNEVPRAGGGTYWEGTENDSREFQLGEDSNDKLKREMLIDIAYRLREAGLLSDIFKGDDDRLKNALLERDDKIIEGAQFLDSLEYGRTVHAEMNAITDAARNGHAVRDCLLFANTFPCHNCAKHIVAAGISEVIYLRPYPKSYASDLFKDSITIDPDGLPVGTVPFRQFIGITGPIFERVFSKRRWKGGDGQVPPFVKRDASFIRRNPVPQYIGAEEIFKNQWADKLLEKGLVVLPTTEPTDPNWPARARSEHEL